MATAPSCRAWLPAAALRVGAVETLLGEILAAWSRDWLARRRLALSGRLARAEGAAAIGDETRWAVCGGDLALGIAPTASPTLARAMLDATDGDAPTTDEDRRVIEALVRAGLDDLRHQLAELAPAGAARWVELDAGERPAFAGRWEGAATLAAGPVLLRVALSNDAVIAAIKGALPRPPAAPPPVPLAAALAEQAVCVSARVGAARVSLAELSALAAGDVLVLDTALAAAATLAVDGAASDLACAVERRAEGFALRLLHPAEGSA